MNKLTNKQPSLAKNIRPKSDKLRQALANESAKIITLEGVRDYHRAKVKASVRLGNSQHGSLPSNFEIELAIENFQQTFVPKHAEFLEEQRRAALSIMRWLSNYSPYLTGPVAEGTVGVNNVISIHISSETTEEIINTLVHRNIKINSQQRKLNVNNEVVSLPAVNFVYKDFEVEVIIFSIRQQFQIPKSKKQNRNMKRIGLRKLEEMLTSKD